MMGDKVCVCDIVWCVNVLIVLGSDGVVQLFDEVWEVVVCIGYLIMIKVVVGGGGCGICVVYDVVQFDVELLFVQCEVQVVFGDGGVYFECFIV